MQLSQPDYIPNAVLMADYESGCKAVSRTPYADLYTKFERARDVACNRLGGAAVSDKELHFHCKIFLVGVYKALAKYRWTEVDGEKFYLRSDVMACLDDWGAGSMKVMRDRAARRFGTSSECVFTSREMKLNGMTSFLGEVPQHKAVFRASSQYTFNDCTAVLSGELAPVKLLMADALNVLPHCEVASFAADNDVRRLHLARLIFDWGDVVTFQFVNKEFRFECAHDSRTRFVHNGVCALILASGVLATPLADLALLGYTPKENDGRRWILQNIDVSDTCRVSIGAREWVIVRKGKLAM